MAAPSANTLTVNETRGRVLVRALGGERYRGRAEAGMVLGAGETVLTGPGARVELALGKNGRWRLGEQVVWRTIDSAGTDAVLNAGTALLVVPPGCSVRLAGVDATLHLDQGAWLITAVYNNGFKVVALDRGTVRCELTAAAPNPGEESAAASHDERRLRAGEVVFAPPGGRGFGPIVTLFLDELLATSRLVRGFRTELPQTERLRQQAAAQRERLTRVSNAFVGGARAADGFQLVVPAPVEK